MNELSFRSGKIYNIDLYLLFYISSNGSVNVYKTAFYWDLYHLSMNKSFMAHKLVSDSITLIEGERFIELRIIYLETIFGPEKVILSKTLPLQANN